jgi:hypothetical protein
MSEAGRSRTPEPAVSCCHQAVFLPGNAPGPCVDSRRRGFNARIMFRNTFLRQECHVNQYRNPWALKI